MYKILVCCATSNELKVVKDKIKSLSLPLKVDFLQLGMGNYNTIFSLTKRLSEKNYDFLINVGVCWIRLVASRKLKLESNASQVKSEKWIVKNNLDWLRIDRERWDSPVELVSPSGTEDDKSLPTSWSSLGFLLSTEGDDFLWWNQDNLWLSSNDQIFPSPKSPKISKSSKIPKSPKNLQIPFYQVANIFDYETWKELIAPVFFKFWLLKTCISANKPIKDLDGFFNSFWIDNTSQVKSKKWIVRNGLEWWRKDKEGWESHAEFVLTSGLVEGDNFFQTSWDSFDLFLLDMESFGFEFVAEKFNLPRIILKVPVDTTAEELEKFDFKKALERLENNIDYEKLIVKVKDFLDKNKKTDEFEKYFKILPFSVSEKEIFKFLAKKYQFVIGEFDNFFYEFVKQNKELPSKQVAKKLLKILKELLDIQNLTKK